MSGTDNFDKKIAATKKLQDEVSSLDIEIKQKQALQQKKKTQLRKLENENKRTTDTRRKVLAGAVVLTKAAKDPAFAAQLSQWLNEGITEERNRILFQDLIKS